MLSYEQKLAEFIEGKSLIRLPRPIRDRADVGCDACGSNHPRTLYALKESESNRHYFVGNTCLKELVKLGVILRRFSKESGASVFEREMELRSTNGLDQRASAPASPEGFKAPQPKPEPEDGVSPAEVTLDEKILIPSVLILESLEHYQAVVTFISSEGVACGWGSALEPRYTKH